MASLLTTHMNITDEMTKISFLPLFSVLAAFTPGRLRCEPRRVPRAHFAQHDAQHIAREFLQHPQRPGIDPELTSATPTCFCALSSSHTLRNNNSSVIARLR